MANVKQIHIEGMIPFTCTEHAGMLKFLGQMNGPTCGIRISYDQKSELRPNGSGKTAFYPFKIFGEEAVSNSWLDGLLQAMVNAGAEIKKISIMDIEELTPIAFTIPKPEQGKFVGEFIVTVDYTSKTFVLDKHEPQVSLQTMIRCNGSELVLPLGMTYDHNIRSLKKA